MSKDEKQSARPPGHLEREETKLWRLALLFLALAISLIAYCIWKARRRTEHTHSELRGVERTPLLPQHSGHLTGEENRSDL